jgi:hypothetical protein
MKHANPAQENDRMTLLNAPAYDERHEKRVRLALISAGALFVLLLVLAFAGFVTGHGWLFSNLPVEHRIDRFFTALEHKDYDTAYAIYQNDKDWKQHPDKYKGYPEERFIDDWTDPRYSPIGKPITTHHVDKSVTDGTGVFGTTVIVGTTVDGGKRIFIPYQRSDGTLTYPAPHVFEY